MFVQSEAVGLQTHIKKWVTGLYSCTKVWVVVSLIHKLLDSKCSPPPHRDLKGTALAAAHYLLTGLPTHYAEACE